MEAQLAEREAELAQCRGQLLRTEELLEKARQAAAKQLLADAAKPAAALPQTGSPAGKHAAEKDFSLSAGCGPRLAPVHPLCQQGTLHSCYPHLTCPASKHLQHPTFACTSCRHPLCLMLSERLLHPADLLCTSWLTKGLL